jgi:hypothetical protein
VEPESTSNQDPAPGPGLPNKRQVLHAVSFNVAMLAELAVALYVADALRERWDYTLVFVVLFIGALAPTIFLFRLLARRYLR